jgi:hypothetical protein
MPSAVVHLMGMHMNKDAEKQMSGGGHGETNESGAIVTHRTMGNHPYACVMLVT